jgi:hypothetical protein
MTVISPIPPVNFFFFISILYKNHRIRPIIFYNNSWLEVLEFEDNALPTQMIVGNGGTKLLNDHDIDNNALTNIKFEIGKPEYNITGRVRSGEIRFEYGYGMMTRDDETGDYNVAFYTWQDVTKSVKSIDYSITIPKGLRVLPTVVPQTNETEIETAVSQAFSNSFMVASLWLAVIVTTAFIVIIN